TSGGGGGGAGMGGAIFVMDGGSVTVNGTLSVNGNSVAGGAGGTSLGGRTGNGGAAFGDGIFLQGNNALLDFNPGAGQTQTVANVITDQNGSGGGGGNIGITKSGAGTTVLTASNTYSGVTNISGGTLRVGNGGNQGTLGSGNVNLAGGVLDFNRGDTVTVANNITGIGGTLSQSGGGITILTGNNTYAGNTVVNAGFLQVGNSGTSGSIGAGSLTLNAGTILFNRSDNISYGGAISGGGSLAKQGAGMLTLTGNNINYSGFTNISRGTLAFNNSNALGTGQVRISGGATLRASASATLANLLEFDPGGTNVAAGGGALLDLQGTLNFVNGLLKFGSATDNGTVMLSSASAPGNVANASVEVAGGTLRMGNANGALVAAGASSFTVDTGATVDLNNISTTIGNLQGTGGTVRTGNNPATNLTVNSGSFGGVITGSGNLVKETAGTLVLAGSNTYTGATTVNAGVLQAGVATRAFGSNSAVTVAGGATLDLNGFSQTIGSLAGAGSVALGAAALTTGADNTSTTFAGSIGGSGSLIKNGTGTLTLSGANGYSGGTTLNAGTLQAGADNAFSATGTINTAAGATVDLNNHAQSVSLLTGNGNVLTGGAGGVLTENINGALGIYRGVMSGAGGLVVNATPGAGLALEGANTYTGTTTINSGILYIGFGTATGSLGSGAVVDNSVLQLNRIGADYTVVNDISGSGTLAKANAGTAILTGNNSYTGTTSVVNAGSVLQVGNGGTQGTLGTGTVSVGAGTTLAFDRSDALAVDNQITGAGTLTQMGGGTVTLTGANTYSGATSINAGTLQVGAGGTSGALGTGSIALSNGAGLAFNRGDAVTIGNVISGNGTLTQMGAGNLILTDADNYSGATNVNAGTLSVNGSITSATTVNNGGILGGTGSLGPVSIMSGGTLAPGNSIGTMNVAGPLVFAAGSNYNVQADASGAADRTNVTGSVTINGGTVNVQAGAGTYARNTSYTILTSTTGTTGTFAGTTSNLAFLTPTLSYVGNNVLLNLQSSAVATYGSITGTGDQGSIAGYLNGFANHPGNPGAAALIQSLDNLTAAQARNAFDSLTGSQLVAASQVAGSLGRRFSDAVFGRAASAGGAEGGSAGGPAGAFAGARYAALDASSFASPWGLHSDTPYQLAGAYAPGIGGASAVNTPLYAGDTGVAASGDRGWAAAANAAGQSGLWAQALGAGGRTASDGNGAGSSYRAGGFIAGYDYAVSPQWLLGVSGGYTRTTWNASTNGIAPANGHIDSPMGALYARYSSGPWQLRINTTYADHDLSATRSITIGTVTSNASSNHHGREWGVASEIEYAIAAGGWQLRPLASLRYARLGEDGFSESGAGASSLTVASRSTQSTVLGAGARALYAFKHGAAGLELRAVASHTFGDVDSPISARLAGQPNSFTANGTPLKRDALTLGAALSAQMGKRLTGFVDVSAEERGSGQNAYALGAGLCLVW
ncbi:MAG: autotransporter protein, partial [Betaproteobacteria bacterium]|nr:autotransporter protein [Betaproteobacteria bacterium]